MLLHLTISQLDTGPVSPERAQDLGHLGYIQWLGGLRGEENYHRAVRRALAVAAPFRRGSPAVAVFCDLLAASVRMPPAALSVGLPQPARRGGARARRGAL
jgi:hypothetical protein